MPYDQGSSPMNDSATNPAPVPQNPMQGEAPMGGQGQNFIGQEDETDERELAYESAFKDSAYNIFSAKKPELIPHVVTFKIIKSSIDTGDAVGAFILDMSGAQIYVPVVMSDNMMKPLELFYSKKMDQFLPFKNDWLQVIVESGNQALGAGIKTPEMLPGDKDITGLIYPPIHGRTSYAMDFSEIKHLDLIKESSNETKDIYRNLLKNHPEFLKFSYENFEREDLKEALTPRQEKIAAVQVKLETVDLSDPAMKTKEMFGAKSQQATKDMAVKGFTYKDERVNLNKVMSEGETKLTLEEPAQSGVYNIYSSDGEASPCVVIVNPEGLLSGDIGGYYPESRGSEQSTVGESVYGDWTNKPRKEVNEYLVIQRNGDYFYTKDLIASPSNHEEFASSPLHDYIFSDKSAKAVTGSNICFIKSEANILGGTKACYVDRTEVGRDGILKYQKFDPFASNDRKRIRGEKENPGQKIELEIVHSCTPTGKLTRPKGSNAIFIPQTYQAVKLGDKLTGNTHLRTAHEVLEYAQRKINENGGRTVKIASAGFGRYTLNGQDTGNLRQSSVKLAEDYNISMKASVGSLSALKYFGDHKNLYVLPNEKQASIFDAGTDGTQMSPEAIQQQYQQQPQQPQPQQPPVEGPNTSMMDIGAKTQDPGLYDVGVINSLSNQPDIRELLAVYSPTLEKSLDNIGRMLLTFWVKGSKAKEALGDETYNSTEESLKTVFKEMGNLVMKLNKRAEAVPME